MTNIGDFKHKIIIQKPTSSIDEYGCYNQTWTDYKTVWASVTNLFGREFFEAQATKSETTVKFIIRYISNLDTTMRISFDDKIYNITFIDDIKYGHKFLEMKCLEVIWFE